VTRRICWAVLAAAMAASAVYLMVLGRHFTFAVDDAYYYAGYVAHGTVPEIGHGAEYFFAPHNSHFQLGGKLTYEVLFDVFGVEYWAFRAVEVAGILIAVGLLYVLARRRVGPVMALAPCILLLFYGYAWEPLLWAFDLHTTYALVFGLAALIAVERGDRRGDIAAFLFLLLSISMIELGLAFAIAVGVSVLTRDERARRVWIFLVPLILYAIWWIWARKFDQPGATLTNVHLIPIDFTNALAAITGSVFGLNPTGAEVSPYTTTVTTWGTVIAAIAVAALILRIRRGGVPRSLWLFLTVLLVYWLTITLGGRPPDSSRYLFAGTVLVFLIAAEAAGAVRFGWPAVGVVFALLALALPPNLAKLYDGRRVFLNDAAATGSDYAMLELARDRVDPEYVPGYDPDVVARGGGLQTALSARGYFHGEADHGALAYSLARVRAQELPFREAADVALIHADRIELEPATAPAELSGCGDSRGASPEAHQHTGLKPGNSLLLGSLSGAPAGVSLSRFAKDGPGFELGQVGAGEWARLSVPSDAASDPWRVVVAGPLRICEVPRSS
jgi:hypothetical protein